MLRVLLMLVLASQSFGCKSVDIREIEWGHHISVDEEGHARGHVKNEGQADFTYKDKLEDEEFQIQYVNSIFNNLEQYVLKQKEGTRLPAQILIFIHGGLNSYKEGLGRIQEFLEKQKNAKDFPNLSSHFLVSLNWEAGLRSALKDHFFQIRYGIRDPYFATATSPIVLFHDLGNSIIKAPDAIYSEAKDLFQNQSADFTSAFLVTGLYASVYGLPIAALHPTLTIASVMPYASYATAGLYGYWFFEDDFTRYSLWPIRMASAPFIEGFGTPAWDMLKRRPDLLLFNPTTKKDGAMGELLKKLANNIKDGKWRTKECENNKSIPCPPVELTLLGHSMGAMVSDRILTTLTQELTFKHIIYIGAANSIADFKVSVIPYLRDHDQTKFWSFALSEQDERNEKYHKYFDFLTRGSLLVWIDLLLERTYGLSQKRFGREVNQEWVNIDDKIAWNRICRISFSGNPARTKEPKKHGDFTEPDNVELVLRVVKNGCPKPVKLPNKKPDTRSDDEFKEDLQEALEHVARFTPKSVAAIANNAPYMGRDDLTEGEFLSDQTYQEIGNYLSPININAATIDELALILRGDRYLAQQIFEHTCKEHYLDVQELERDMPHLSEDASDLIDHHGTFGKSSPTKPLACPLQDRWPYVRNAVRHWWSNVHINPFYKSTEEYKKIRAANTRYLEKVMSEIEKAGISILPIEKARTWYMFLQKTPWDAILDVEGQRVAIETHTWAELEDKYHLDDQDRSRAKQLTDNIIEQVAKSDVDAVIFVTNEDVFSKQSMAKAKEALQNALGEKFHSIHGLPKTIPDKIKSILQRHKEQPVS